MTEDVITPERHCLDCDHPSTGSYCPNCGQKMELSESIGQFMLEALPGIARGDGRYGETIKLLLLNPGKLTRRFHEGKRTRYLSPLGMLLSAIFVLFTLPLIFGLIPGDTIEEEKKQREAIADIATEDADITQRVRWISIARGEKRKELISDLESEIFSRNLSARLIDVPIIPASRHAKLLAEIEENDEDENWIDRRLETIEKQWDRNPELKFISLRNTFIKYSWFLVPLSLPLMMVLMPGGYRDRFKHTLFAGYSLSFMLLIVTILLSMWAFDAVYIWIVIPLFILALVHLFVQTKNAYRLRWLAAIGYYLAIIFCAVVGLVLFILVLFFLNLI